MNVPPWAGFAADFPDDQVETGGDIQVYGGRNVAVALSEIFIALGCRRVSAPESSGIQGWEFDFHYDGRHRFWCRVQSFHPPVFWLLLDDLSATVDGGVAYVEFWRKLGMALEQDPRFHKIIWRSFEEGPPDWDEVEAASDPPGRTFEEEFPPGSIEPKKPGWGCSPIVAALVFVVWPMASGISGIWVGLSSQIHKERVDDIVVGIGMLAIGLGILASVVLEAIKRRRGERAIRES